MNKTCWYCGFENSETEHFCSLCRRPVTKDTSGKHTPAASVQHNVNGQVADPFVNGITKVTIFRRDTDERGKERIREIKKGIIVSQGTKFARVYDNQPVADGGDTSQTIAEKFPFTSPNLWIVKTGELKYQLQLASDLQ